MIIVKNFEREMKKIKGVCEKILHSFGGAALEQQDEEKIPVPTFILAGGAMTSLFTNTPINDLDIYIGSNFRKSIIHSQLFKTFHRSKNAINVSIDYDLKEYKVQFITNPKFIGLNINELLNSFDFTCCMAAYNIDNLNTRNENEFYMHEDFLHDICMKKLIISRNCKSPIGSLLRIKKYMDKGYTIDTENMIKLSLLINSLKIETVEDFAEHMNCVYNDDLGELIQIIRSKTKDCEFNKEIIMDIVSDYYNNRPEKL